SDSACMGSSTHAGLANWGIAAKFHHLPAPIVPSCRTQRGSRRNPMNDLIVEPGAAFERLSGLDRNPPESFDVIVIGAGQAGLSVGYHLKRKGVRFLILDAHPRIGDAWRTRWDTLRLFSPSWLNALDGLPFPGPQDAFPTKDEMADYLEGYARHFELPVRTS